MRYFVRLAAVPLLLSSAALAQDPGLAAVPPDPEILQIAQDISVDRIQRAIFVLASFKTRQTLSDPLPSGDGIGAAGAWIRHQFDRIALSAQGRLQVDSETFTQPAQPPLIPQPVGLTNICATLPGTDPAGGLVYVVAAHYDSRADDPLDAAGPAPGADDDASGVAALLEMTQAMAKHSFRSTLVFLATGGGEQYGNGAAHWADEARRRGLPIAGVFELEAIGNSRGADGRIDRATVRLFAEGVQPSGPADETDRRRVAAGGENDSPSRELARAVRSGAARYPGALRVRLIYRADRRPAGDGSRPWLDRGFATIRFAEAEPSFRPWDADDPDGVDFDYVATVAQTAAVALGDLARAPPAPPAASTAAGPDGGTLVRWGEAAGASGYRVVWRESTAPFWEHVFAVPAAARSAAVDGVSPENAIFGVVAVDAVGHASPAAYALPFSPP